MVVLIVYKNIFLTIYIDHICYKKDIQNWILLKLNQHLNLHCNSLIYFYYILIIVVIYKIRMIDGCMSSLLLRLQERGSSGKRNCRCIRCTVAGQNFAYDFFYFKFTENIIRLLVMIPQSYMLNLNVLVQRQRQLSSKKSRPVFVAFCPCFKMLLPYPQRVLCSNRLRP